MKNCLGIEIGHYRIKIAYAEKGELKEFISERVQGMELTDMHVCADLIKDLLKEYAIRCRNVVFVIRQEDVYVRRFEMPLMTEEQLRLNLPVRSVAELLPEVSLDEEDEWIDSPQAYGVLLA